MIEIELIIAILERTINEFSCQLREYGKVTIPADSTTYIMLQGKYRNQVKPEILGSYYVEYEGYFDRILRLNVITMIRIEQTSPTGSLIQEGFKVK